MNLRDGLVETEVNRKLLGLEEERLSLLGLMPLAKTRKEADYLQDRVQIVRLKELLVLQKLTAYKKEVL